MRRFLLVVVFAAACRHPPTQTPPSTTSGAPAVAAKAADWTWRRAATMRRGRVAGAGVTLADGRVMVAGGFGTATTLATDGVEFYDPASDRWSDGPPLSSPRYAVSLIRLKDGRVLAVGGRERSTRGGATGVCELFDPKTGRWSPTGSLRVARESQPLALLPDGRVLAAGGYETRQGGVGNVSRAAELYDPRTGEWSAVQPLPRPRTGGVVLALQDGRVLSALGSAGPARFPIDAHLFDPASLSWREAARPLFGRENASAFLLPDGKVMVAGGTDYDRRHALTELYDPSQDAWSPGPELTTPRLAAVPLVSNGRFALVGGIAQGEPMSSLDAYEPEKGAWRPGPSAPAAVLGGGVARLHDGRLLVFGGQPTSAGPETAEAFLVTPPGGRPPAAAEAPAPKTTSSLPPRRGRPRRPERAQDYAVVVGVESYRSLPPASYAENDASAMASALLSLGVPEENVVHLEGGRAGLTEISKYIEEWLPRRTTKDSRVYVFFSGHGAPDIETGAPYLMPWDGDATFVKSTGFSLERLYASLERLPASEIVVALDSCFSGSGGRSVLAPGLRPLVNVRMPLKTARRVSVLAASEASEAAGGLPATGHGAFTYHLVAGLNGAADADADGHLTLAELHAYARKRVILDARGQNREQTPTLTTREPGLRLY